MNESLVVQCHVRLSRSGRGGRKELRKIDSANEFELIELGQLPRVTRWMALAIRIDGLVNRGEVGSYADVARLGHVSRARLTQIMNLRLLAPEIQEAILFLPRTLKGRDPLRLADLQPIAAQPDWPVQRQLWPRLSESFTESP
jgi:hypothetical protein